MSRPHVNLEGPDVTGPDVLPRPDIGDPEYISEAFKRYITTLPDEAKKELFHYHEKIVEFFITRYCLRDAMYIPPHTDRKSTRLNSSHLGISYAVFCLKKKK